MKCKACGEDKLAARVTLTRDIPLAQRGGGVKVGGVKVSQLDLKEQWETEGEDGGDLGPRVEKKLRGPIFCNGCNAEHFYIVGAKDPLFHGSYAEAVELGVETFLEG